MTVLEKKDQSTTKGLVLILWIVTMVYAALTIADCSFLG